MVLGAKILNSDASLNDFFEISSLDFVPGSQADLVIRLTDLQRGQRYVAPIGALLSITVNKTDGSTLTKSASPLDALDRSMWKVTLSSADTTDLLGGNFQFSLDVLGDQTKIISGLVNNGLRSLLLGC